MADWDTIMREAERLAGQLETRRIDLNEAQKAGAYYRFRRYDEEAMARYLQMLADDPPPRSQRTQAYYRGMRDIWSRWQTPLTGQDKARAWGWAIRLARRPQ